MANVKFSDVRKTVTVSLPSYPGSEVVMYDSLLFGQVNQLGNANASEFDKGLLSLQLLIADWNFVDEKGDRLPITLETLGKFSIEDITVLSKAVSDLFDKDADGKKKSLKT